MEKSKPTFSVNMQAALRVSRYGRELPHYKGYVCRPGSDVRHDVSLWSGTYTAKDGQVLTYWNGSVEPVSTHMSAKDQIQARATAAGQGRPILIGGKNGQEPIEVQSGRMVMFEAKHETGNIADNGKRRADTYGYWNDNGELIQIGGYINARENRLASIVGKTQFPLSKEPTESLGGEMSQDDIDAMNREADMGFREESPAEQPKSRRARGGR